ncbi:replication protein [Chloroflexota bacterium]
MTSPLGFTKIPNRLIEALARINLNAYESRVIWFIIRKTYGWHKDTDWISLSQLSEGTLIKKSNISRTIKSLVKRNIVTRPDSRHIGLQEEYFHWLDKDMQPWGRRLVRYREKQKGKSRQETGVPY